MTEKEALYCLCHVPGMGAVTIRKLYGHFSSCLAAWEAGEAAVREAGILRPPVRESLLEAKRREDSYRSEYERLGASGIAFTAWFEDGYPKRLKAFDDRPAVLFSRGSIPADDKPSAAIVGARNCSEYGRAMAEQFGAALSEKGVQIISGLALGVDGAAHRGALKAGGKTFAVLGCGINICYPKENYDIFSEMAVRGGILSEFLPGAKPAAMNFPMRNRIISGLSDVVLIVEAREKSGSLITADLALEQGKEVFALPGRTTDALSAGCNRLIQMGASPALSPGDVLECLGIKYEKKITILTKSEKCLAKNEKLVYSCLDSRPRHLEEIAEKSGLPLPEVMEDLLGLELSGLAQRAGSQYYYCRKL